MKLFAKNKEEEGRRKLKSLIESAQQMNCPKGWIMKTFAIGGLTEVGFSLERPELLLVVSSQGRGLIDCTEFSLLDRNNAVSGDWINYSEMWCMGLGQLKHEKIKIAGLKGGGLPNTNQLGDSIELLAPDWPIIDLIFQPALKNIYQVRGAKGCFRIFHNNELRAYGFSSNGEFFICATSSEVYVYKKNRVFNNMLSGR